MRDVDSAAVKALCSAALAAALAMTGCKGDHACIQWSEQDGACPARADALDYLLPPCDDPIESVDSEPEFDGQACCYEITKGDGSNCGEE